MNKKTISILFITAFIVYVIGMFNDIMNIDAAQYASISREMLDYGHYLVVKHRFGHYLDKPPLLFWLSSLSFRIFGFSNFAYRLPSFLFTLLGTFSTYRLGKLLYNKTVGSLAALILFTCQAFFMFNHDVRTDTILAGAVIFSIWQLAENFKTHKTINFLLGFLGIGAAMLTKGPIGIMVPVLAFGTHFIYKKEWKNIFRWQWLTGCVIVLIMLLPMLWGLYQHSFEYPDNVLYQKNKYYGIKFYFWIQSFGRLTGASEWRNNDDPTFYIHTFLWSFLPWSIIAFTGIFRDLFNSFKKKYRHNPSTSTELITLGGVIFPFIAFSMSHYVLPHYIFVIYPLIAIISAKTIEHILQANSHLFKIFFWTQNFIILIIWIGIFLICYFVFPTKNIFIWLSYAIVVLSSLYFLFSKNKKDIRLIIPSAIAIIGLNFILNFHFYPELLKYQSDINAAKIINANHVPKNKIYAYLPYAPHSFDFLTGRNTPNITDDEKLQSIIKQKNVWVFTSQSFKNKIDSLNIKPEKIYTFKDFPVTLLTPDFLNPQTRENTLRKTYLLKW